jgi:hypothetical protein
MSLRDGNGPIVSVGVTAQLAFVLVVVPPVDVVDGLVGESPHAAATAATAAPIAPKAARRLSRPAVACLSSATVSSLVSPHSDVQMLGNFVSFVKRLRRAPAPFPYFCNICRA